MTLVEADLDELPPRSNVVTYQRGEAVFQLKRRAFLNRPSRVTGVVVSAHANLRLGGDYLVQAHLSKSEIARLFYLTHKDELKGLLNTLKPISEAEDARIEAEEAAHSEE